MMNRYWLIYLLAVFFLTSCEKDDTAIVLPPPGDIQQGVAVLGLNYDNQAYVNLSGNTVILRNDLKTYDLAFDASGNGMNIYLNGSKLMMCAITSVSDLLLADSSQCEWKVDQEKLNPDSTAFGPWWNNVQSNGESLVYLIDRGTQIPPSDRYRKFQVLNVSDSKYRVRFSKFNNSALTEMDIPKDSSYALMFLSFDNGGQLVNQAPPKDQWDFVFTRYTHVYFDQPVGSIYRNYTVTGALFNVWSGTKGYVQKKDSTPGYLPFDQINYNSTDPSRLSNDADVIGFDWKDYDFNNSRYFIIPDLYYIIVDRNGIYYKFRILDYYDSNGTKGTVTYQFQRL